MKRNKLNKNMNQNPLFSIIMTVFNGEKYLYDSILSILNQTYTEFEFIIINDGSKDRSNEIIHSFKDKRIIIINNEENLGQRKSRNKGIKKAIGKYIAMFDSDDIAKPIKLQELYNATQRNNNVDVFFAESCLIDKDSNKICNTWYPSFETILKFKNWNFICHSSVLIKKSVLENNPLTEVSPGSATKLTRLLPA